MRLILLCIEILWLASKFSLAQLPFHDHSLVEPPLILQDPASKVIFYVESDKRHVAAISPEGKLLWCDEVFFAPENDFQKSFEIRKIEFQDKDTLYVLFFRSGFSSATINKKTGEMKHSDTSE